ncbi:MAG: class I SAM-dependent methyltransferase [Chloroflexi bacterium]|nr:class I SAM-dependent methyltransferase [Chloroflexota bacterium]
MWTGHGFILDGKPTSIVSYVVGASGWSDNLTTFHEEHAGTNHPIDVASRNFALEPFKRLSKDNLVVLEVGCSSGYYLRLLRDHLPNATVIGSDYVLGPLRELATTLPDVPIIQLDLVHCPLPSQSIDVVVMLNVLEHIQEDAAALRQVYRVLRPGGLLILEVPAGPLLYDVYDRLLLHYRRYSMRRIRSLFAAAGFEITSATHLGAIVFPGFAAVKLWNRFALSPNKVRREQETRVVSGYIQATGTNPLLSLAFALERWLGRWISWPFGIRCVLVGRRPE